MGFNEFLSSIFGNKSTRDMKEIQPWVNKIKAAYPEVAKLDNDGLRAKTQELKQYIHDLSLIHISTATDIAKEIRRIFRIEYRDHGTYKEMEDKSLVTEVRRILNSMKRK